MSLYNRLTQRNVPVAGPNPNMTPMTRKPMGLRDALQKYADGGDVNDPYNQQNGEGSNDPNSIANIVRMIQQQKQGQTSVPPEEQTGDRKSSLPPEVYQEPIRPPEPTRSSEQIPNQIPDPYGGYTPVSPPNPREDLTTLVQQAIRGTADKQVTLDDLQEQFPNVPKETLAAIAIDFERQRQEARDRYYAENTQVQSPLPPVLRPNQPSPQPSPYDTYPQPQYVAPPINVPPAYPEPQYAVPPQPYTVMPPSVPSPVPNFAPPEAQPNYGPQFAPPEAQPNYGPQVAAAQPNYGPQPASTNLLQNILGASGLRTGLPGSGINKPTTTPYGTNPNSLDSLISMLNQRNRP
jgi:hypothetical protein